uniref:Uncharacterized protein n=1 Tax=Ignisphaera aggregans TaxID=334771 RepID=A0A7C2VMP6_9CREN
MSIRIKNVCLDYGCDYVIARSFLDSFYYVKIVCKQAQLDDVNNRLSSELSKHSNVISWVKTEIIEVK